MLSTPLLSSVWKSFSDAGRLSSHGKNCRLWHTDSSLRSCCSHQKPLWGEKRSCLELLDANPHWAPGLSTAGTQEAPLKTPLHSICPSLFLATKAARTDNTKKHTSKSLSPTLTCREEGTGRPSRFRGLGHLPYYLLPEGGGANPGLIELASKLIGQEGKACLYF